MSLTFVQGDTAPDLQAIIHEEDDDTVVVDLTGASVRFQMRYEDGKRYKVNSAATILDELAGSVSYSWAANDLSQPGTFIVQWEVTYPGGRIQTTSPEVEITVEWVNAAIDAAADFGAEEGLLGEDLEDARVLERAAQRLAQALRARVVRQRRAIREGLECHAEAPRGAGRDQHGRVLLGPGAGGEHDQPEH